IDALPPATRALAVLDRTKEPGSIGEPLYLDVLAALHEAVGRGQGSGVRRQVSGVKERAALSSLTPDSCLLTPGLTTVIGGRYGLSSKEFTPAMARAVFDELARDRPRNHFTIGIHDDVTHTSLAYDPAFSTEDPDTVRAVFYGL